MSIRFLFNGEETEPTLTVKQGEDITTRTWYSITSSADGTKLAAVHYNGYIYTLTYS